MASAAFANAKRVPFSLPVNSAEEPQLRLYNSLTETKTPFVPRNGRDVFWYSCGPTVYDSAHLGHARNYVTLDILRRVMQDYFAYNVHYQVNITDIDDKIILRARQNHLFEVYVSESASRDVGEVRGEVEAAIKVAREKVERGVEEARALPDGSKAREALMIAKLKLAKHTEMEDAVKAAQDGPLNEYLAKAKDAMCPFVDEKGSKGVSEHSIFEKHSRRFEEEWKEDMRNLNVRSADYLTRITDYVPEVVAYVERLVEKKLAYAVEGSVYFDTVAWKESGKTYPKLKAGIDVHAKQENTSKADLQEGEGSLGEKLQGKKHPNDFALWKASKDGEPRWESKWGEGRPGWHIECSVMAHAVLGDSLDIHSGGEDLKFPHHENEAAQAEAHSGCSGEWVNYWIHMGHLKMEGLKMSKSLKNFQTIREILETVTPDELRLMFLTNSWDSSLMYSTNTSEGAKKQLKSIKTFLRDCRSFVTKKYENGGRQKVEEPELVLMKALQEGEAEVHARLCDSIHTPGAMEALMKLIGAGNAYLTARNKEGDNPRQPILERVSGYVERILTIFGLQLGASDASSAGSTGEGVLPVATVVAEFRDSVRAAAMQLKAIPESKAVGIQMLQMCDQVRENVLQAGVLLEDVQGAPTTAKILSPAEVQEIMADRQAKAQALEEEKQKKLQKKLEAEANKAKKAEEKAKKLEMQRKKEEEKKAKAEAAAAAAPSE